eukprot:9282070-Ditylum_brightwellii.AAC.1
MEKMDLFLQSLMKYSSNVISILMRMCSIDANRNVALPSEAAGMGNNDDDDDDGNINEIETVEETIPIDLKKRMAMDLIHSAKGI